MTRWFCFSPRARARSFALDLAASTAGLRRHRCSATESGRRLLGRWALGGAVALWMAVASQAVAQEWPNKPIRFIMPFTPGASGGEILARLVSERLSKRLGQPVVLDYKSGASGVLASQALAQSAPDGHTIALITDAHSVNPHLMSHLPYDSSRAFAPVTQLVRFPLILVSAPSKNLRSAADLIAAAKAKPGKLAFASGGPGSAHHMAMATFLGAAGIEMTHVPYKGGAAGFADVLAGHVDVMFFGLSASVPQIENKKLVGMGVSSLEPQPSAPQVPPIAGSGLPGYQFYVWMGILAPAGTPGPIVERLSAEIRDALNQPDARKRLNELAFEVRTTTPAEFEKFLRDDAARYGALVKSLDMAPR